MTRPAWIRPMDEHLPEELVTTMDRYYVQPSLQAIDLLARAIALRWGHEAGGVESRQAAGHWLIEHFPYPLALENACYLEVQRAWIIAVDGWRTLPSGHEPGPDVREAIRLIAFAFRATKVLQRARDAAQTSGKAYGQLLSLLNDPGICLPDGFAEACLELGREARRGEAP